MLANVGIPNPQERIRQYAHEFSGVVRQRVVIAMALVCRPELLIADEPTTALDVTIQAQILTLIKGLQAELETSVLFITHDIGVMAQVADDVCVMYRGRVVEQGPVRAVDDISFQLRRGETLGIVGESGSGKTTAARAILRAIAPTTGEVWFHSPSHGRVDLASLPEKALKPLRKEMQMIFQDPFSSLNPRMTVGDIVGEPLEIHGLARGARRRDRVAQMLEKVELLPQHMQRYLHAFSGGQRQRIGIARALIMRPKLVVADEAVSALDVSVQAQGINLLQDLQDALQLTYVFVAHDLSVVRHICNRVAVMYLGRIVEFGPTDVIFDAPRHPYTQALLSAIPVPDPDVPLRPVMAGEIGDVNRFAGMDMTPVFHD